MGGGIWVARRNVAPTPPRRFSCSPPVRSGCSGLGLLELSLGHPAEAAAAFETTVRIRGAYTLAEAIALRPVGPSFIESLVRAGELEKALSWLDRYADFAEGGGRPVALAGLERCRGLIASEDVFGEHFRSALDYHEQDSDTFERARTQLCFAERLRRQKRRMDARELSRAALESFERIGAALWADRARAELRATGERARRRTPDTRG